MSASGPNPGDIFDVRKVRRLVELMNEHDLNEIDLRQGDQRIRLRRGPEPVITYGDARQQMPTMSSPGPAQSAQSGGNQTVNTVADDANIVAIKSPMVGTFYSAANPDSPPFVKVGDHVGPDSTVCIIEAMKVFNEIPAEVSGQVVAVLAENGEPVEFGQPLFKINTRK